MREKTVVTQQEQHFDVAPEKMWELVGSAAALSLLTSGGFAFGVPAALPGTDRLCCLVMSKPMRCALLDVLEEVPGQTISWQTRSTVPVAKEVVTLSVRPQSPGCAVSITIRDTVDKSSYGFEEAYRRGQVKDWIDRLRAIAEGRMAWPQAVMPAAMQQECMVRQPMKKPAQASVTVMIKAPVDTVWRTVWAPETVVRIDPDTVFAGHVPGTPEQDAGEMQYVVCRQSDDTRGFTALILVVLEVSHGHKAVVKEITLPNETSHLVTAVPGGTRLELTDRWPTPRCRSGVKVNAAAIGQQFQATVNGYKTIVESSGQADKPA